MQIYLIFDLINVNFYACLPLLIQLWAMKIGLKSFSGYINIYSFF